MKITRIKKLNFIRGCRKTLRDNTIMDDFEDLFFDNQVLIKQTLEDNEFGHIYKDAIYLWEHSKIQSIMVALAIIERDMYNINNQKQEWL